MAVPAARALLGALALALSAGCAAPARAPQAAPAPLLAAILSAARSQAHINFRTCSIGWTWPLGAGDTATAFTCTARYGALYAGAAYSAPGAPGAAGLVRLQVVRVDHGAAFTETELDGQRLEGASSTAAGGGSDQYLIVAGVVNRTQILALTVTFGDGQLGMMTLGGPGPRVYAFVHSGAQTGVRSITAYDAGGQAIFAGPPFPPQAVPRSSAGA